MRSRGGARLNPRNLHIGGKVRKEGWEVLDITPGPHVDHVGDAADLSRFPDDSFGAVYASHVLEHFDFTGSIFVALAEWRRVLRPGGRIYLSVPDLEALARLFLLKDRLSLDERFNVVTMIFGAHVDQHDYHRAGLDEQLLAAYLRRTGYTNICRVPNFGLFDDTSNWMFAGKPISLNMTAEKPGEGADAPAALAPAGYPRNQPCHCGSGRKFKHCHGKRT